MNGHSMVRGTVVDQYTGAGLSGARVEAWDASNRVRELVLYARTDDAGRFSMELAEDDKKRLFGDARSKLYFRVFEGTTEHVLFEGRTKPLWRPENRPVDLTIRVTTGRRVMSLRQHAKAVVRGTVHDASGPLESAWVRAFDEHLGTLTPLAGPVKTDEAGRYRIEYDPASVPHGKQRPDLVVKASVDEPGTELIAESTRRCRVPASAVVPLVKVGDTWRGLPRFARVSQTIESLLGGQNLGNLTAQQRERLACTSRLSPAEVEALASARALSASSSPLSEELAYGLIRRGLPAQRESFFLHGIAVVKKEVRAALAANDVTQVFARDLDATVEAQWVPAAAAWALEPRSAGTCGLAEILNAAGVLDTPARMGFAMAYCRHEGTIESFWDGLSALTSEQKSRTQLAMQWWTLTRGHDPLMQHLESRLSTYGTFKDLCALDHDGWIDMLGESGGGVPSSVPGGTTEEKQANYARLLDRTMAAAFPTPTFVGRVGAQTSTETQGVKAFFANNATFELGKTRVTQAILTGMQPEDIRRVKAMNRLFKLVPRYEEVKGLIDAGYPSAHAIQDGGKGNFISKVQDLLGGAAEAEEIYMQACHQVGASSFLLAKYGAASNSVQVAGLPNWNKPSDIAQNDIPDWQTLFGTAGGCACKHCASVLSASAYLVDLLQWLSHFDSEVDKGPGTKWSALDVLVGPAAGAATIRRPDLKMLELSCKSSHTPLPYIDLVNEILEVAVSAEAANSTPTFSSAIRTSHDADELLAGPEIIHPQAHLDAWSAANAAKHPFTLPVDLWAQETNTYLRYVGVSRADVIQALHGGAPDSPTYRKALAKARLSIRELGHTLLTDVSGTSVTQAWGMVEVPVLDAISVLNKVPAFLRHAGLSFQELEELLAARYVNGLTGNGGLHPLTGASLAKLVVQMPEDCDLQAATLPALSEGHLLRIHGFLRLVRRTGLSITDLDRLVCALPLAVQDVIDGPALQHITEALALAERLSLSVGDAAALYSHLDTWEGHERKSPYRVSFLNRMVDSPDTEPFKAILTGQQVTGIVGEHRASFQQALSLSAADFDLLTDGDVLQARLKLPANVVQEETVNVGAQLVVGKAELLSIDTVSKLYRAAVLARALRLSIADFLVLRAHAAQDPLGTGATPASTAAFCDTVQAFQMQRMRVPELQHVLRGFSPPEAGLAPHPADIEALRSEIEKEVDAIHTATEAIQDPDGERAKALLTALLTQAEAETLHQTLVGAIVTYTAVQPLYPYSADTPQVVSELLTGTMQDPTSRLSSPEARFAYVAKWLERHLTAERAIVDRLAAFFQIPASTVRFLLTDVLKSPAGSSWTALSDFLPARRNGHEPVSLGVQYQTQTLYLLERHARLIRLSRTAPPLPPGPDGTPPEDLGELLWIYPNPALAAGLHKLPAATPTTPAFGLVSARQRFAEVMALARRVSLRDRFPGGPGALRRLLAGMPSNMEDAKTFVVEQTGWERATVDALAPAFNLSSGSQLSTDMLERFDSAVRLIQTLGLAAGDALGLVTLDAPEPTTLTSTPSGTMNARDQVLLARRAAKAKVSAAQWAQVARGVRDPFRETLRDALLAYLVPRVYTDTSEAFAMLLIDPEMSPCQRTSRVVQATTSVQVFIQRSFLNLDSQVKLPADAAREWEFLKAYRLWEANRKVFLHPENWLDPELRDDKTPLFEAFETKLRQGDITDATAERAVEAYLNGLDEIARLQAMATCFDAETGTTHIVARTQSVPRKWFYRRHTEAGGFSPWEAMGLDIDGEGLLLAVENRRLYLFWPILAVRPAEEQPSGDDEELVQRYDIRIAWSSFMDGAWAPKRMSTGKALPFEPAMGDMGSQGYTPDKITLVRGGLPVMPGQVGVGVIVRAVEMPSGTVTTFYQSANLDDELYAVYVAPEAYVNIGQMTFDPCGGGRWQVSEVKTKLHPELSFLEAGWYTISNEDTAIPNWQYSPWAPWSKGSELGDHALLTSSGFRQRLDDPSDAPLAALHVPRPDEASGLATVVPVLDLNPFPYRLVATFTTASPKVVYDRMIVEDPKRSLFVRIDRTLMFGELSGSSQSYPVVLDSGWEGSFDIMLPKNFVTHDAVKIEAFDHPFVCDFSRALAQHGVSGLLGFGVHTDPEQSLQYLELPTDGQYGTTQVPADKVQFDWGGAYSAYNWELFFHVPFFIATRLATEGRHDEARRWFHFIFDPTTRGSGSPNGFWKFRQFYENQNLETIQADLDTLAQASSTAAEVKALLAKDPSVQSTVQALEKQLAVLLSDPFNPHAIARHRILAFQKAVVMRYIDNLLDWADTLFRRDTMESTSEALSLYLLAGDLLGPRPQIVEHREELDPKTFEDLRTAGLDAFSNAAVEVEAIVPAKLPGWLCKAGDPHPPTLRSYFCVPQNDVLLGYWDRVADRLFKLRHCLNIEGVKREIPLFAPPIDPALLIKAKLAGVSLDKVLDALAAPAPLFRFLRLHAKAMELTSQVAGLGQSLLAALEKKDGEELLRLRQGHELTLLGAERESRQMAIREARETLAGLERQKRVVARREEFYRTIRDRIPEEERAKEKSKQAQNSTLGAGIAEGIASTLHAIPDFFAKAGLPPDATTETGGLSMGAAASAVAAGLRTDASLASMESSALQTEAGYVRRRDEWRLQAQLAVLELAQLDKQIVAQEIRLAVAEYELTTLELRTSQSREIDELVRTKYTGQELYDWMVSELAAEHRGAYRVAYDMAKRAERAYQLELGDDTKTFIRFGAWDDLKRGLLSGERLLSDLRALDAAYLSRSDREREITKHVSLAELARGTELSPYLVELRDTGRVEVVLPEWLFDADYPGHYFRRLKAVSVTVATVRSAADGVQCEVALLKSQYRKSPLLRGGVYPESPEEKQENPGRFHYNDQAVEALSTSTADDDAGLFQLDLRDEKLLPYEGHGAVGTWAIEVPKETNRFPLHRISDVVLHLRYTSRDAGGGLSGPALVHAKSVNAAATGIPARRVRVLSARAEAPEGWARFLAGETDGSKNRLEIPVSKAGFLPFFGSSKVRVVEVTVSATFAEKHLPAPPAPPATPPPPPDLTFKLYPPTEGALAPDGMLSLRSGEPSVWYSVTWPITDTPSAWVLEVDSEGIPNDLKGPNGLLMPDALEDLWLTFTYEVAP